MATYWDEFQIDMRPGERVMWTGQPNPSVFLSRPDVFLIPFSAVWATFAIGMFVIAIRGESPNAARTVVLGAFSLAGLYLLVGRFVARRWLKRRTYFAVTSERILILSGKGRGRSLESFDLSSIGSTKLWINRNGVGTLQFGDAPVWRTWYGNTGLEPLGTAQRNAVPVFFDIGNAEAVAKLVDDLRQHR